MTGEELTDGLPPTTPVLFTHPDKGLRPLCSILSLFCSLQGDLSRLLGVFQRLFRLLREIADVRCGRRLERLKSCPNSFR